MPTIAIVAPSSVPFQIGGAEKFWWGLHKGLAEHSGTQEPLTVELLKIPCREQTFAEIVGSYRTFSELDLSHFDMVISSKYPAWMVRHPRHIVYMQHTLRGLYDTYHFTGLPETVTDAPAPLRDLLTLLRKPEPSRDDCAHAFALLVTVQDHKSVPSALFAFPGPLIREVVHFFDRVALGPSQIVAYAAISNTVMRRGYLPAGADVKIIHHPSDILNFVDKPGEYIFTASRLTNMKRVHLIVEAMRHVTADIPLRIAGTGSELERLKSLAGSDRRIEFLGHVPDADLPELYGRALFVPFVPYDEDYGLITIEAMRSGKPVLTVHDAGGVGEFVVDGKTGYCTEPTPEALGAAMQRLASDPDHARAMGRAAQDLVSTITWKNTTTALFGHLTNSLARNTAWQGSASRPNVLVLSTFSAANPITGGQRRVYQLCKALSRNFCVHLLCLGSREQRFPETEEVLPVFLEIRLPWSAALTVEERELTTRTGASVVDLACMRSCANDPDFLLMLAEYGAGATLAVAAHPYLAPALLAALPNMPMVYDAHNVEADMKGVVLHGGEADQESITALLSQIREVEGACCAAAQRVLVCSTADADRFVDLYGLAVDRVIVVPNGFDAAEIAFTDSTTRRKLRQRLGHAAHFSALFMGSWHQPNLEAVAHIVRLAPELPEVQFLVAGGVCRAFEGTPPNVHLLGEVSEAGKNVLLRAANVSLNPVTSGAGTNLKIIESVAAGLETLSTSHGLRGMDDPRFTAGVRVGEIAQFTDLLRQAMTKPIPDDRLRTAAQCAAECFSWQVVMASVPDTLLTLARPKPAEGM